MVKLIGFWTIDPSGWFELIITYYWISKTADSPNDNIIRLWYSLHPGLIFNEFEWGNSKQCMINGMKFWFAILNGIKNMTQNAVHMSKNERLPIRYLANIQDTFCFSSESIITQFTSKICRTNDPFSNAGFMSVTNGTIATTWLN